MSGFEGFDKYCEDNNISQDETPAAFAAYLNQQTGWDGKMGEVPPIKPDFDIIVRREEPMGWPAVIAIGVFIFLVAATITSILLGTR